MVLAVLLLLFTPCVSGDPSSGVPTSSPSSSPTMDHRSGAVAFLPWVCIAAVAIGTCIALRLKRPVDSLEQVQDYTAVPPRGGAALATWDRRRAQSRRAPSRRAPSSRIRPIRRIARANRSPSESTPVRKASATSALQALSGIAGPIAPGSELRRARSTTLEEPLPSIKEDHDDGIAVEVEEPGAVVSPTDSVQNQKKHRHHHHRHHHRRHHHRHHHHRTISTGTDGEVGGGRAKQYAALHREVSMTRLKRQMQQHRARTVAASTPPKRGGSRRGGGGLAGAARLERASLRSAASVRSRAPSLRQDRRNPPATVEEEDEEDTRTEFELPPAAEDVLPPAQHPSRRRVRSMMSRRPPRDDDELPAGLAAGLSWAPSRMSRGASSPSMLQRPQGSELTPQERRESENEIVTDFYQAAGIKWEQMHDEHSC